jgi:localization factor PodJL
MQPDLPWNVAGIPPEAREAARAAARREGLSVGEWLTRRILRNLSEGSEPVDAMRDAWRQGTSGGYVPQPEPSPMQAASSRDTDDMLARVSRSENETHSAYRRIEEQLRNLARRLDATERSQSENSRAMSKAATEINIAAREQAQAFDQLGSHVVGLNERISRVERIPASDGLREAVKGLHQGLSRVADQIAETANQSATQIAALANNVESVAGRLLEARDEMEHSSKALNGRIAVIDERVRAVERAAHSSASAMEKTLESIESTTSTRKNEEAEIQRQAYALAQLGETLERLATKFAASEAQTAGAMARLEESVIKFETRNSEPTVDRRLQGIEHALSDIAGRLETTERSTAGTAGNVEENLRNLTQRVDAADKRQRDAVAELRAAVKEANGRLETVDPVLVPLPPAPPPPPQAAAPAPTASFDLPPFPDMPPPAFQQPGGAFANTQPIPEPPPAFAAEPNFGGAHAFGADAFAATAVQQANAAGTDSYLSAARRAARSAAEAQPAARSGFSWGFAGSAPEQEPQRSRTRFVLVGGIALIAVLAILAGVLLSRGLVSNNQPTQQAALPDSFRAQSIAAPTQPSVQAATQPQAVAPNTSANTTQPSVDTVDNAPPGSPRIPAPRLSRTHTTAIETHPIPAAAPSASTKVAAAPATNVAAPQAQAQTQPPQQVSLLDRLTALANSGNAKGEMLLGLKYLDGDGVAVNEAEAAKWLERAATQNDAIAAYRLGTLYERGHGVAADPAKAVHWYEVAAQQGNRKAMHNLAVAYAQGTGTTKDLAQAAQWFSRAANLGLADSQFNLAVLYERGMGVPQSLPDAFKWYAIAASQGDAESKARIDALSTQLSAPDRTAAQHAADAFKPQPMDRSANIPPDPAALFG